MESGQKAVSQHFGQAATSEFFHTGQDNKTYDFNASLRIEHLLPTACNQREDIG